MPITSSAKKALRQNKRRRAINIKRKSALQTAIKQYKKIPELQALYKAVDKAAKSGFIKKNKANRIKSRMASKAIKK